MGSNFATLSSLNALAGTPINASVNGVYGSIYVPASMLSSYKTSAVWSAYAARFVGVE